ncbi:colicin V production protein [Stappia sp. 22II-S9-Z10]|nr:CvpA family protein [Acuticoccus yangtzensis]ORE96398.1 colicin V production protein [Stappia sp. 22II-S9-Z10]
MNIAILDGVVIAVVFISAVLAMFRGFVREVLSIAAWVAAAVMAYMFYEQALPYVLEYVDNRTIAVGLSAAGIFLASLIVVSLITMKISDFVMDSPVGAIDRLVGFVFGAARGLLLVVVAVIFFNWLVAAPDRPAWVTTAASYPKLSELGDQLLAAIPDDPEQAIRGAFEGDDAAPAATPAPAGQTYDPTQQQQLDQTIDAATDPAAGTTDNTVIQPQPLGGNESAN